MRATLCYDIGTALLVLAGVAVTASLVTSLVAGASPQSWWSSAAGTVLVAASIPFWVLNRRRVRAHACRASATAAGRRGSAP